jgi:hypothetical protein
MAEVRLLLFARKEEGVEEIKVLTHLKHILAREIHGNFSQH